MKDKPTALDLALEMSRYSWERRERTSNPWAGKTVARFVTEMDRAGYIFHEYNYPFDGYSIVTRWDQLWAWACSIADNERDTLAGR